MKCKCCYFEKFISNNDELERFARVFYIQWKEGEKRAGKRRDRDRESVRESIAIEEK